jgi:hypothetical protein
MYDVFMVCLDSKKWFSFPCRSLNDARAIWDSLHEQGFIGQHRP